MSPTTINTFGMPCINGLCNVSVMFSHLQTRRARWIYTTTRQMNEWRINKTMLVNVPALSLTTVSISAHCQLLIDCWTARIVLRMRSANAKRRHILTACHWLSPYTEWSPNSTVDVFWTESTMKSFKIFMAFILWDWDKNYKFIVLSCMADCFRVCKAVQYIRSVMPKRYEGNALAEMTIYFASTIQFQDMEEYRHSFLLWGHTLRYMCVMGLEIRSCAIHNNDNFILLSTETEN